MPPQSLHAALHFSGTSGASDSDPDPNVWASEVQQRRGASSTHLTIQIEDLGSADSVCWLKGALQPGVSRQVSSCRSNRSSSSNFWEEPRWHKSPMRSCTSPSPLPSSLPSPALTPKSLSSTNSRLVAKLQEAVLLSQLMESPQNGLHQRPICPSEFESDSEEDLWAAEVPSDV
eukprot:GGOE01005884.1.p2 GENE.GGOE01005884.1~~GGOE01005884.1.p2  ORF type:complete len:174 (-),score=30.62 GGOE01005884.1:1146-1667(-)